jgi:hypothetical protein
MDLRLWFKASSSEESGNVGRLIEWKYQRAGTLIEIDSTGGKANLT